MTPLTDREIQALISLLADEDEAILREIRAKLTSLDERVLPFLESARHHENPAVRSQVELVLEHRRWQTLGEQFKQLAHARDQEFDLERGVLLLAQFRYPDMEVTRYILVLDEMARAVAKRLQGVAAPRERIQIINQFLFEEEGFHGNTEQYYDPDNSYFNHVLDRKVGIPITLSCLYLFLAKRLDLPIVGVGMPAHFLVRYKTAEHDILIDPFQQGRLLSKIDCVRFLEAAGIAFDESHLNESTPREILIRMIRNLIYIYTEQGDNERADQLGEFVHWLAEGQPRE